MALRLTFRGTPCPFEWGVISETICDLATALLLNDNWNPDDLHASQQQDFPSPQFLPNDIPFKQGRDLIVDVFIDEHGTHDIYIDDLVGLGLDLTGCNNRRRSEAAPLLAIDACSCRVAPDEPIPRLHMAALHKLSAECRLEETKMILGWLWDFRQLKISLPINKYNAWSAAISKMINDKMTTTKDLDTTIGRLTHVSMIIPFVHHFLSRLWELLQRSKRNRRRSTHITAICLDDLRLMRDCFLANAHAGISMNQIAYRCPTHVYRSDSCPAGMGGYSAEGFAWCFPVEGDLKFRASNNLLEHLASIISPWVDILTGRIKHGNCSLLMTDSTTSEGWLRKSTPRKTSTGTKPPSESNLQDRTHHDLWRKESGNTASGFWESTTKWLTHSPATGTVQTTFSQKSFSLTSLHRFRFPSKLYPFPTKSPPL
jgi:hypothetical protein